MLMPLGMVTAMLNGMATGMVTEISLFEGFKMVAVQYWLTYKDYAVCMGTGNS